MLPGGSITGCPKARTMEWIDRLNPVFVALTPGVLVPYQITEIFT